MPSGPTPSVPLEGSIKGDLVPYPSGSAWAAVFAKQSHHGPWGASADRSNANHHRADKVLVAEAKELRVHYRATMPAETARWLIMDLLASGGCPGGEGAAVSACGRPRAEAGGRRAGCGS